MILSAICICFFVTYFTEAADIESYEINKIQFAPLYDAIIFNDIADIMNELEKSMMEFRNLEKNPELSNNIFSGSSSNEDIEDLLSEYQYYLDKVQAQRINYMEKTKGKNKVPQIHREKFLKMKQSHINKHGDISKEYIMNYPKTSFIESFNGYVPHYTKESMDKKPGNIMGKSISNIFSRMPKSINEPIPSSSCYCIADQVPCKCGCKQCLILFDSTPSRNFNRYDNNQNIFIDSFPKSSKYIKRNNVMDDKINIRIKIDLQLPKISGLDMLHKYRNQDKNLEILSKEIMSTINLPFSYFPIPVELQGYKQIYNNLDSLPVRKMSLHKKKKSRSSNIYKKHAGKKIIPFHNINIQMWKNNTDEKNPPISNHTMNSESINNKEPKKQNNMSENGEMTTTYVSNNTKLVHALPFKKLNSSTETIHLTVNMSKINHNDKNESFKIENSIETDYVDNKTSAEPLRSKREILYQNVKPVTQKYTTVSITTPTLNPIIKNYTKETKKFDKTLVGDMELLYWPIESKNVTIIGSKNITALILERETKKTKLNLTHDIIRFNRTMALEQAIFGEVDWNDVDTVAPVFISFVGKYIRGILTFCSESLCHSMNCAEKICFHRICTPDKRFNHKGHCIGNNDTDSVAAMESIMDLPSNIVFEIVDILQNKMLGKMYGKATMCIISKCSTFVASKKTFQRFKCVYKELSSTGHCPFVKNFKIV